MILKNLLPGLFGLFGKMFFYRRPYGYNGSKYTVKNRCLVYQFCRTIAAFYCKNASEEKMLNNLILYNP
ncbi:hypothetical protein A8C56_06170 [Niabella ginsenosidivorans]|uniref:Uncharacterized protein n=1 Tax=Niabella ginsenosidivorans TaxID=1176587 RepID=A0A1A9I1N9_9BACT|nr:hypothetical protein A8C56_06170 [Niabella ginsenosidivorans]